jgi:hypothetical protein
VSEATARAFWPGEDPIGRSIEIDTSDASERLDGYAEVTVIGTVRDIVSGMLIAGRDPNHVYLPMDRDNPHATAILARRRGAGGGHQTLDAKTLQDVFRLVTRDPQVFEALPLTDMRDVQMYPLRAASWIGSLLGAVALALSVSGLYGVLTYALSQRKREIGIRMALGATAGSVVAMVVNQSMRLAGIGALIGAGLTPGVLMLLNSLVRLQTIAWLDVAPFAAGAALIIAATALAAYQPARHATRVDPSKMLRYDA